MTTSKDNTQCICPRIKDTVNLALTYSVLDNRNKVISALECESKDTCGVARTDNRGNYFYENDKCPAIEFFRNR